MTEINKDELLDIKKWQRFFFMLVYGVAVYFVVGIFLYWYFVILVFCLPISSAYAIHWKSESKRVL